MRGSSYTAAFWECTDCSDTMKGFRNGVSIFLSTGYCIGSVIAIVLNFILPEDYEEYVGEGDIVWDAVGEKSVTDGGKDAIEVEEVAEGVAAFNEEEAGAAKAETSSEEDGIVSEQPKEIA